MRNSVIVLSTILLISVISLSSRPRWNDEFKKGTYGCKSLHSEVFLTLNEDQTFLYVNKTNPNRPVEVSGSWSRKGHFIRLFGEDFTSRFPRRWRIDLRYDCVRSGLSGAQFIRLCHSGNCSNCTED